MREQVARLLHRAGALQALARLRRMAPGPATVTILTYHHVHDDDPSYGYDPDVADATPAQFRRQMEMLVRYGTPIGMDELIRAFDGAPLPKNPVMVTFDDGYRSCHDVVLPILRAVGMRATFFVPTSFVEDRRLFWWERIAVVLKRARHPTAVLTYPRPVEIEAGDPRAQHFLADLVKNTPEFELERFLVELAAAFGVDWDRTIEAEHATNLVMSWDQVRALARAGMDVESHGRNHRVLGTLGDAELHDELTGSRADLETQLGRPVRAIAYPVGRRISRRAQRVRAAIAAAGYVIGLSNASGATRLWPRALRRVLPVDRFDVKRMSTDRAMSDAMYFTQIVVPSMTYIGRHDDD